MLSFEYPLLSINVAPAPVPYKTFIVPPTMICRLLFVNCQRVITEIAESPTCVDLELHPDPIRVTALLSDHRLAAVDYELGDWITSQLHVGDRPVLVELEF